MIVKRKLLRRRERVDDDGDDYVYWYRAINRISVHQRMDWQKLCADQYLSLMTRRTIKCYLSNSLAFVLSSQSVLLHLTAFPCLVTQSITTATVIWTGCSLSLSMHCAIILLRCCCCCFCCPADQRGLDDLFHFSLLQYQSDRSNRHCVHFALHS